MSGVNLKVFRYTKTLSVIYLELSCKYHGLVSAVCADGEDDVRRLFQETSIRRWTDYFENLDVFEP